MKKKTTNNLIHNFMILLLFFSITFMCSKGTFGFLLGISIFFCFNLYVFFKVNSKQELTNMIFIPILLSIFQNVYLGIFCSNINSSIVMVLTIFNFIITCTIFISSILYNKKVEIKNSEGAIFVFLIIYILISALFISSNNLLSIVSSLRNIISIFIFYFIVKMNYKRINIDTFLDMILITGVIVIFIGFYEIFIDKNMWVRLNITELWTKKGINLQASGLPTNFFSSETIHGERIRRMASTFADPVNLGAFLLIVFYVAIYKKNNICTLLSVLAIVFTVSKGALLGILIYTFIYAKNRLNKETFSVIFIFVILIGLLFLVYAYKTSANSVFLHISGFINSLSSLINKPFGYGIGTNGVLASQFSGQYANSEITETGLGMIISQLGIFGLLCYIIYFKKVFIKAKIISDPKIRIISLSILISIIFNIMFNEVALSPNSCALYFMILGYYCNNDRKGVNYER